MNLVANTWGADLEAGDEIVLSDMEHHSNIVPWQLLAARTGARLRYVELDERGRLDLDWVSDQDYLTEFRQGLTGFEETRDYYRDKFGRDIDDFNDPVRTNQAVVNKNWSGAAGTSS